MPKKLTLKEFIIKAKQIHGDKYDYSQTKYVNHRTPVEIYCKKHKKYFMQTANNHLSGKGCLLCGREALYEKASNTKEFIKKAKKIHGNKYNYNAVNYIRSNIPVKIFCNVCKKYFMQRPNIHLMGGGCRACAMQRTRIKCAKPKEKFIEQARHIHGERYDYSQVEYINSRAKVKIFCNTCHRYFMQSPGHHLFNTGCPYCCSSKGELQIQNFLEKYNIRYQREKRFKDCCDKKSLPFDFYLPEYNMCIEYQGKQHYIPVEHFDRASGFCIRKKHDHIKKKYCKNKGIKLLEITYKDDVNLVLTEWYELIEKYKK